MKVRTLRPTIGSLFLVIAAGCCALGLVTATMPGCASQGGSRAVGDALTVTKEQADALIANLERSREELAQKQASLAAEVKAANEAAIAAKSEAAKAKAQAEELERQASVTAAEEAQAKLAEAAVKRETERTEAEKAAVAEKKAQDIAAEAVRVALAGSAEVRKYTELLKKVRDGANAIVIDPVTGELDVVKTMAGASTMLPPPWNLVVMGGLGVVGAVSEYRRKKTEEQRKETEKAAVSIVKSIDRVINEAPGGSATFKEMPNQVRSSVRSELTPLAAEIIDAHSTT